jgi:rod shape-determining protein MreD
VRPLRFLGALALTVLVHVLLGGLAARSLQVVDVFLVLIVLNALGGSSLAGLLGGTAAGLTRDALAGAVFGLHGFAGTIIGYAASRISQRLVLRRAAGVLLLIAAAVLVHAALLLGLSALVLPELLLPNPVWLLIRAAVSGVLGAVVYVSVVSWRQGADSRRRRRTKRLKLR